MIRIIISSDASYDLLKTLIPHIGEAQGHLSQISEAVTGQDRFHANAAMHSLTDVMKIITPLAESYAERLGIGDM